MRKAIFSLALIFLTLSSLSGQTYLYFRAVNPRIIRSFNSTYNDYCDNLEFDVEVKASSLSYYYALEIHLTNDTVALKDLDYSEGILSDNGYYTSTFNLTNGNINLAVASTQQTTSGAQSRFEQISTYWQILGTLRLRIADPSLLESAVWISSLMQGQQYEKTFSPNGIQLYAGFTCNGIPFDNLYLGRIFSSGEGWSQFGGTQNDMKYLNWTIPVNTSVWDSIAKLDSVAVTNRLRIHDSAQFILDPGAQVNCFDSVSIDTANGLWIRSNSSSTASFIDNGIISCSNGGSAMIDRYLSQDVWHGYCIPVNSTNTLPFHNLQLIVQWYDEPEHKYHTIVNPAGDSILNTKMLGYFVYSNSSLTSNSTISMTGTPNTGDISIPVTATLGPGGPDGWNLIGNPYPSGVIWPSFILNNVDPTMYIFDPQRGNYIFWNSYDATHTTNITPIIPGMQGFYVHCHAQVPGTGNVAVNNGARVHENYLFYKSVLSQGNLLVLSAYGNGYRDEAQIWYNDSSTTSFDWKYDVYKRWGNNLAPQFYSELPGSIIATMNVLPWADSNLIVPMGYKTGVAGTDTIIARNMQSFADTIPIWISDLQENRLQKLTQDSVYIFQSAPTDAPDRFRIYFKDAPTGIRGKTLPGIEIYSYNKIIVVKNESVSHLQDDIFLFDLTGREVFSGELKDMNVNRFYPNVNEGCYIVRVISANTTYTRKVYLK
jgi:hypothetical protein